ncbi:MAG TPA: TIM barrel protein [Pirellulales bacterium]|nr:TIM barrel protein [Pirellulales bacterium]
MTSCSRAPLAAGLARRFGGGSFSVQHKHGRMKLGLINSTWVQAGRPTEFGLRKTKAIGFDAVDIFVDPLDLDARERRLIRDICAELALPIISLPCVAVGLADPSQSVRDFHRRRVEAYLDLAYDYRAKNVLVVIGEYIWNKEVIPPAEQWSWAVEGLQRLGERAGELGLRTCLQMYLCRVRGRDMRLIMAM